MDAGLFADLAVRNEAAVNIRVDRHFDFSWVSAWQCHGCARRQVYTELPETLPDSPQVAALLVFPPCSPRAQPLGCSVVPPQARVRCAVGAHLAVMPDAKRLLRLLAGTWPLGRCPLGSVVHVLYRLLYC